MSQFTATLSAYVVLGIMLAAGLNHMAHLRRFEQALRAQTVWPKLLSPPLAVGVAATETALGLLGLLTVLDATPLSARLGLRLAFPGAALLLSGYAIYGLYLRRRRPDVPCACSSLPMPITVWVVLRAGLLAALATIAVVAPQTIARINADPTRLSVVALAGLAVGILVWELPEALHNPTEFLLSPTSPEAR